MAAHHLPFTHHPGRHCGSTALHNAMVYHGLDYSEALCFGLACGLGFFYAKLDGTPLPRVINGRSRMLETDFFETIQQPWTWNLETDSDQAWQHVAAWVDRDVPVMLRSDIFYLDYYNSSTHFAGHTILLVGYDDEHAYLSDTQFDSVQHVTLARLDEARSAAQLPMPLEYHWHQLEKPGPVPAMRAMMLHTMRRNAEALLDPDPAMPIAFQGVAGMRTLAQELPDWPDALAGDWSWTTRFAYQIIERRGTGGGHFRYLYADFLREVEAEVPELAGAGLSAEMHAIGEQWTALSDTFKTLSENAEAAHLFQTAGTQAQALADAEYAFYERVLHETPEP